MMNYLDAKVREVSDATFQSLVTELCMCVGFNHEEMSEKTFRFLLMAIVSEKRKISSLHAPKTFVLDTKVNKLTFGSVVWQVCAELGELTGSRIEAFDGKTVLTAIKQSYKKILPKLRKPKLTKARKGYNHATSLILRRRQNGSL